METKIIIYDVHVHPETGYVTYTLQTVTKDGSRSWMGPKKQYGTDQQMLRDRFNSDIAQFEAWAAREHRAIVGVHPEFVDQMMKRKGQVIP
jgi:hypothetical protein